MAVASLRRGPSRREAWTSRRSSGGTSPAISSISPRANVATLTTNSQFPTSRVDPPVCPMSFSQMKQRRLASSRGEDKPILRALLRAHIGEIVGIGGRLRRALYEKSDRGGVGRLGGRLAQRIP